MQKVDSENHFAYLIIRSQTFISDRKKFKK